MLGKLILISFTGCVSLGRGKISITFVGPEKNDNSSLSSFFEDEKLIAFGLMMFFSLKCVQFGKFKLSAFTSLKLQFFASNFVCRK
jgi:hypothetical protein